MREDDGRREGGLHLEAEQEKEEENETRKGRKKETKRGEREEVKNGIRAEDGGREEGRL